MTLHFSIWKAWRKKQMQTKLLFWPKWKLRMDSDQSVCGRDSSAETNSAAAALWVGQWSMSWSRHRKQETCQIEIQNILLRCSFFLYCKWWWKVNYLNGGKTDARKVCLKETESKWMWHLKMSRLHIYWRRSSKLLDLSSGVMTWGTVFEQRCRSEGSTNTPPQLSPRSSQPLTQRKKPKHLCIYTADNVPLKRALHPSTSSRWHEKTRDRHTFSGIEGGW